MKKVGRSLAAVVLFFVFTVCVYAGQMDTPLAPPSVPGQMDTPLTAQGPTETSTSTDTTNTSTTADTLTELVVTIVQALPPTF